jgi:hypothetical protein
LSGALVISRYLGTAALVVNQSVGTRTLSFVETNPRASQRWLCSSYAFDSPISTPACEPNTIFVDSEMGRFYSFNFAEAWSYRFNETGIDVSSGTKSDISAAFGKVFFLPKAGVALGAFRLGPTGPMSLSTVLVNRTEGTLTFANKITDEPAVVAVRY